MEFGESGGPSARGSTPGGVKVAAGYSSNTEAAENFAAEHPGSSVHQGNIGNHEDCERVVEEVLDTHGQLDILVNNAGITGARRFGR